MFLIEIYFNYDKYASDFKGDLWIDSGGLIIC